MKYSFLMFLLVAVSLYGTNHSLSDSFQYLSPKDTIFLQTVSNNRKVFLHVMKPTQTLYTVCRFYGITSGELYLFNPEIKGGRYKAGDKIKIPMPNRSIIRFQPEEFKEDEFVPIYYIVGKGKTLFQIAHKLFKLPVVTLLERNNLTDTTLLVGQKLKIGWMSISGIPKDYRQIKGTGVVSKSALYNKQYNLDKETKQEYARKGPAIYIKGAKSGSDLFVMHRDAAIGSIVAVTNPMKRRTIYTKVIANIPKAYDSDIEVVVSPKVGELLGAIDEKFYVKVKYLK